MESLWVAKTGLEAQQTRLSVISQNLANINTTGYKSGRAIFEDLLYQNVTQPGGLTSQQTNAPTGLNLGTGVRMVATDKQFSQGNLVETNNPLDVAIEGRGFFQILMPDGTQAYTRDGTFQINAQGQIVTSHGSSCSRRSRFRTARRASRSASTAWSAARCRARARRCRSARCSSPTS